MKRLVTLFTLIGILVSSAFAAATAKPAVAQGVDIKVTVGSGDFEKGGNEAYWHSAPSDHGGMIWTWNVAQQDNFAKWRPNFPQTGNYEVLVYIPNHDATTRSAKYEVHHRDGVTEKVVNQYNYNNEWVSLGTYPFSAGKSRPGTRDPGYLFLGDVTGEPQETQKVGFSAARFVLGGNSTSPTPAPTDPPSFPSIGPANPMVTVGSGDFERGGNPAYWHEAPSDHGGMIWTWNVATQDNFAKWRPTFPSGGNYEVFVFIPDHDATTRSAKYEVHHRDGVTEKVVNQYSYNNQWVSLGVFWFNAGKSTPGTREPGYLFLGDVTGEPSETQKVGFGAAKFEARSNDPPATPVPTTPPTTAVPTTPPGGSSDLKVTVGSGDFEKGGNEAYWRSAPSNEGGMIWTWNVAQQDNFAKWRPNFPQAGNYEVLVYIPDHDATTRSAKYEVHHRDGVTEKVVNQYNYNNEWVSLGTYPFSTGKSRPGTRDPGYLFLGDVTGDRPETQKVGFSAARFVLNGVPSTPTPVPATPVPNETEIHYFALGDSIASGHGLMDDSSYGQPKEGCRRSDRSYPWKVLFALRQHYSNAKVPIHHLACSGASTGKPSNLDTKDPGKYKWFANQLEDTLKYIDDNPSHLVLVSITIGANDFEFSNIDATRKHLFIDNDQEYRSWVQKRAERVRGLVEVALYKLLSRPNVRVVVTGVYNPFNRKSLIFIQNGGRCGKEDEKCYARTEDAVRALNDALQQAVQSRSQPDRLRFIGHLYNDFQPHASPKGSGETNCGTAEPNKEATWIQHRSDPNSNSKPSVQWYVAGIGPWLGDCFHPNETGAQKFADAVYQNAIRLIGR